MSEEKDVIVMLSFRAESDSSPTEGKRRNTFKFLPRDKKSATISIHFTRSSLLQRA